MNELARIFQHFLGRDIIYIFSGSIPLLCVARILNLAEDNSLFYSSLRHVSIVWIVLATGVSYAIAYALQEFFCLIRVSSTAAERDPRWFTRILYGLYQRRCWTPINENFDVFEAERRIERNEHERQAAHYERLVSLMQLGTTLGPSFLLSGTALLGWRFFCPQQNGTQLDVVVGLALLIFSLLFFALGKLKRAQVREYLFRVAGPGQPN
jgi:hypothetical protein